MRAVARACGGFCAGVMVFFLVLNVATLIFQGLHAYRLFEKLPDYSLMGDIATIALFWIAAVAGAYVCARIAKPAQFLTCIFFGIGGGLFSFLGISYSVHTPNWFFFLRGFACLLGAFIGYVFATRHPLLNFRNRRSSHSI